MSTLRAYLCTSVSTHQVQQWWLSSCPSYTKVSPMSPLPITLSPETVIPCNAHVDVCTYMWRPEINHLSSSTAVQFICWEGVAHPPGEYWFFSACSIMNPSNLPVSASCSIGLLSYVATCNTLCGCGCWSSDSHALETGTPQTGSFPLPSYPHRRLKSNALSLASLFYVLIWQA